MMRVRNAREGGRMMGAKIIAIIALSILLCGCASEMAKGTVLENKELSKTVGSGLEAIQNAGAGSTTGIGGASTGAGNTAGAGGATPETACIELCKAQAAKGTDLSSGPCIGNPIAEFPEWVCDVAHSPRTEVDNLQENQCSAFGGGRASHFVEVDKSCKIIKVY